MKTRDEILKQAANGNADALAFLQAFARRAHWVDDLRDRDHALLSDGNTWYGPEIFAAHEAEWLLALTGNQFFLSYRAQLVPAMILALSAWVDSHKFTAEQQAVIKGQWHEVVYLVAWLTGGWNHMRRCAVDREYDVEIPIVTAASQECRSRQELRKDQNGLPRK